MKTLSEEITDLLQILHTVRGVIQKCSSDNSVQALRDKEILHYSARKLSF